MLFRWYCNHYTISWTFHILKIHEIVLLDKIKRVPRTKILFFSVASITKPQGRLSLYLPCAQVVPLEKPGEWTLYLCLAYLWKWGSLSHENANCWGDKGPWQNSTRPVKSDDVIIPTTQLNWIQMVYRCFQPVLNILLLVGLSCRNDHRIQSDNTRLNLE